LLLLALWVLLHCRLSLPLLLGLRWGELLKSVLLLLPMVAVLSMSRHHLRPTLADWCVGTAPWGAPGPLTWGVHLCLPLLHLLQIMAP
jgi:hypothetical protein